MALRAAKVDPIAALREQPSEADGEIGECGVLAVPVGAKSHRGRLIKDEPGGEVAVLGVQAYVRLVQAGGHVPVDVPDVVLRGVAAQAGEVDPGPRHPLRAEARDSPDRRSAAWP